jgi:hypothetical protein
MSPSLKLGFLALVSTAAAVPHYGHNRFHKPSGGYGTGTGAPYPTGGWPGTNSTGVAHPTGTAAFPDELTTTIDETLTQTTTIVSTVYINPSPSGSSPSYGEEEPSSVVPADVYPTSDDAKCGGPETIYVTATNQVTVTVTAGEASSPAVSSAFTPSSSAAEVVSSFSSSEAAPTGGYEAPSESFVLPSSSSTVEDKVTVSIPQKGIETPYATPEVPVTSDAPVASSTAAYVEEKSSAAPSATPSSAPVYSGGKRGLAYNEAGLCSKFEGMASWAYSWGSSPGGKLPQGVKFIPMPWIKNEDASAWLKKVDEAVASGSNAVMGFNEVDHPAQANLLPDVACQKWADYMNPIAASHPDVTIIGPSVTNAGDKANWGLDWYKNFMSVCPNAQWHAANIHFYDIYQEGEGDSSTINRFKKHIENAAKLTGKKVWVTEFGLNEGSSAEDVAKFVKAAMQYMDGSDLVGGYSYFMVGTGPNQLVAGEGLSEIGQIYAASTY